MNGVRDGWRHVCSRRVRWALLVLWVAPASLVGLLLALPALCSGARLRTIGGVLECSGGRVWLPAKVCAITLGHVVIGRCAATLERWRSHEHAHVRQYERWGALFFLAYPADSLYRWLRGEHPYRDNRFERAARAAERAR